MNEHFFTLTVKVFPLKGFALYTIIVVIFCRYNRFYTLAVYKEAHVSEPVFWHWHF